MTTITWDTFQLGDIVLAAFDEAATHTTDPREVSRRAANTVNGLLRWAARSAKQIHRRTGGGRAFG